MPESSRAVSLSTGRCLRLFRILQRISAKPVSRAALLRDLKLEVRGFYRDMEKLRRLGICIELIDQRYRLGETFDEALEKMPFPDPGLSLLEAIQIGKGRTKAHRRIREQIRQITGG